MTVTDMANVSKCREIIESDCIYTIRDIAKSAGISLSWVYLILKRILKLREISARWIQNILTDDQKRVRVQTTKQLLKMFPKFNHRQFANISTGVETWIKYFEQVR